MTDFLYIPATDFKQVQLSRLTKIFAIPGGFEVGDIFNPQHGGSLQGTTPDPAEIQRVFINGKDAFTIAVTDNGLTADSDYLVANGLKIFFGTGSSKIAIGSEATETETNIKNFLDALDYMTASIVSTNVQVVGTGRRPNLPLTITTNATSKITITDVTSSAGTAATMVITIGGDLFLANSQNRSVLPLTIASKPDYAYINAITPSNATTPADVITRIKAIYDKAHAGTAPDEGTGLIYSQNLKNYSEISAALVAAFGASASTAYAIGGTNNEKLTITYGTKGTLGNAAYMLFGVWPAAPEVDFYIGPNSEPILGTYGPGIPLGSSRDYNRNDTPQTANVSQDSGPNDLGTGLTGLQTAITFTLNQVHKEFNQRLAAGAAAVAADAARNYVIPGAGRLEVWGFIAVVTSEIAGQFHLDFVPKAIVVGGLQRELTKASTKGLPISASTLASDSIISTGFSALFRQIAQV